MKYLKIKYPQNYIIKNPIIGASILFVFSFSFMLLYHPLNAHKSFYFDFELTMLIYTLCSSLAGGLLIIVLKKIPYFSEIKNWIVGKEILAVFIVLLSMGMVIYLLGFIIESPAVESRWNFSTFFNSCISSFMIYSFPFAFFSIINYKFLYLKFESTTKNHQEKTQKELTINIRSKLKKESLAFQANELLYTVSDGNYVIFHLYCKNKIKKSSIRNSISDIEKQLKDIPFLFRCHRGFIINLNMVDSKKGNASGYILKIKHCSDTIPVSRLKVKKFNELMTD